MCNLVEGKATQMGLVGWKNQEMVYCLTSECNLRETYVCYRRKWGDHRAPTPHSYITIQQIHVWCRLSRYTVNSLQHNGYGTESMVIEVVILFPWCWYRK